TPRNAGIGEKAARRVILLSSLLSAAREGGSARRNGILERILAWGDRASLPGSLHGLLSTRADGNVNPRDRASGPAAGSAGDQGLDHFYSQLRNVVAVDPALTAMQRT